MTLSLLEMQELAARASTLLERLRGGLTAPGADLFEPRVEHRLDRWRQIVSRGRPEGLALRLALDGLDEPRARAALAQVEWPESRPLPDWTALLDEVLRRAPQPRADGSAELLLPQRPLPFQELLLPFVEVARERVSSARPELDTLLAPKAAVQLRRSLLARLCDLSVRALQLHFSLERARRRPVPLAGWEPSAPRDTLYRDFIDGMLRGGLGAFFFEYPVLSRLLATATGQWVATTIELLERLRADSGALAQRFAGLPDAGRVEELPLVASDAHNGGRSVVALRFSSGLELVYKPRSLGLDAAFRDLAAWLHRRGLGLDLTPLRVLDRGDYGWMELAHQEPCESEEEVRRYYVRAGMLVAVVYALQGMDCHQENLIACGEYPLLVDLETLLQPRRPDTTGEARAQALVEAEQRVERSVLRTGLLPTWDVGPEGRVYDVSGLTGVDEQISPFRYAEWAHVNTDDMVLEYRLGTAELCANGVFLNGARCSPHAHVEDVATGFKTAYRCLLEHREALCAADGPLAPLASMRLRFVFRSTKVYISLREKLLNPKYLRDGADRGLELESLTQGYVEGVQPLHFWPLVRQEQESMEQLDVPYFATRVDGRNLGELTGLFERSAWEEMEACVRGLGAEDLAQQLRLLNGTFQLRSAGHARGGAASAPAAPEEDARPLAPGELVSEAARLAEEIQQSAITCADGSATWIGPSYLAASQRFQIQPFGLGLYDGNAGVALFLAALWRATREPGHRDLALAALRPARQLLRRAGAPEHLARELGLGACTGLGSILYALARAGVSLGDEALEGPELVQEAASAAAALPTSAIREDRNLDLLSGAAGFILALLAIHREHGDPRLVELAAECGRHLLDHRVPGAGGLRGWQHPSMDRMLTGLSHGQGGIAYALLQLYGVTRQRELKLAAEEAIALEDRSFLPERGNWLDTRGAALYGDDGPHELSTWCYGAPGLGLARLGGLAYADTADTREKIEAALATTAAVALRGPDHVCCGTLGILELPLVAAELLERPELEQAALSRAARVVARARRDGGFALPQALYSPAFFVGTAGMGYQLLRLANPRETPSVLMVR